MDLLSVGRHLEGSVQRAAHDSSRNKNDGIKGENGSSGKKEKGGTCARISLAVMSAGSKGVFRANSRSGT